MFEIILKEYKNGIYNISSVGSRKNKIFKGILFAFTVPMTVALLANCIVLSLVFTLIFSILMFIFLIKRDVVTPDQYRTNNIEGMEKLLKDYDFYQPKWIDLLIDECESEKKEHSNQFAALGVSTLALTVVGLIFSNYSILGLDKLPVQEQKIYNIVIISFLSVFLMAVIFLRPVIEFIRFPRKALVLSFERDLKYMKTFLQVGQQKPHKIKR